MTWDCGKAQYCDAVVVLKKLNRPLQHTCVTTYFGGFQSPAAAGSVLNESRQLWEVFTVNTFGCGFVLRKLLTYFNTVTFLLDVHCSVLRWFMGAFKYY